MNTSTAGEQYFSSVAALPDGNLMITWRDVPVSTSYSVDGEIKAQLFDAAGNKVGAEFMVNVATAEGQTEPQIVSFGSGDLALLWLDYDAPYPTPQARMRLLYSAVEGTGADDALAGTADRDFYSGLGGNDDLGGAAEADELSGGDGNDRLVGGSGQDRLDGGNGNDQLFSHDADPAFAGAHTSPGVSYDILAEVDTLIGGAGTDYLFAGYGDHVDGGTDDSFGDRLYISFRGAPSGVNADFRQLAAAQPITIGGATIAGIESVDFIEGSEFADFLAPYGTLYPYATRVCGRGGNDQIIANAGAGFGGGGFWGGEGNDTIDASASLYGPGLYGEAGDDILTAGSGIGFSTAARAMIRFAAAARSTGGRRCRQRPDLRRRRHGRRVRASGHGRRRLPARPEAWRRPRDVDVMLDTTVVAPTNDYIVSTLAFEVRFNGATITVKGISDYTSGTDTVTEVETLRFSIEGDDGSGFQLDSLTTRLGGPGDDVITGMTGAIRSTASAATTG